MKCKLFTKSAFKIAMGCPTRLYYYYDSEKYANQDSENEFLQALAKGGFQVGALAKLYCGVGDGCDLGELKGYDEPLKRTAELMDLESVVIAEAAFRYKDCFVRADIVRKTPAGIDLIEVKAKSWENGRPFVKNIKKGPNRGKLGVDSDIAEYVYDVAFQKYVLTHALAERGINLPVRAFLMMPDKTVDCDADMVNQYFRIANKNGRVVVHVEAGAEALTRKNHVLREFDVDGLCDKIIAGVTCEQTNVLHGRKFVPFIEEMSEAYCNHTKMNTPLSVECYKCPFYSAAETPKKADGYDECWRQGMPDYNPQERLLEELMGNKRAAFENGVRLLRNVSRTNLYSPSHTPAPDDPSKLTYEDRRILQVSLCTDQPALLGGLAEDVRDGVYLDKDGLKAEMNKWKFPLHMIDFETTTVALPFYSHMRPYEQVAFQFSHHVIESAGPGQPYTIRHAGQWINTEKGHFPNFDFIRALKRELENDDGTIFRYATHENTVLNKIREQLLCYPEEVLERHLVTGQELKELVDFIDSITCVRNPKAKNKGESEFLRVGNRNMVDLRKIVSGYYYDPSMKGSESIKYVLPAVLNGSGFLKRRYSEPIYGGGAEIPSLNILPPESPKAWVCLDDDGKVENPYKWLPEVNEYLPEGFLRPEGDEYDEDDLTQVNQGGAALTAYSKIQFSDLQTTEALRQALLRYCELDTMAMVFIWEYFNNEIHKGR